MTKTKRVRAWAVVNKGFKLLDWDSMYFMEVWNNQLKAIEELKSRTADDNYPSLKVIEVEIRPVLKRRRGKQV